MTLKARRSDFIDDHTLLQRRDNTKRYFSLELWDSRYLLYTWRISAVFSCPNFQRILLLSFD